MLPVAFWFKDFLTLSKCREGNIDSHGLEYDKESKGRHLTFLPSEITAGEVL